MKLGKLSLVAVMALGTSAFAIDNVKVNGEAKLWYQTSEYSGAGANTTDIDPNTAGVQSQSGQDFFDNGTNSNADIALSIGATADLLPNLSAGAKFTALSTLGLENNLVGATSTNKIGLDGTNHQNIATGGDLSSLDDQAWVEELYLAYTMGKTTAKVGRQPLATPLAFTEDWNVVNNTFEAAVLLNNDIKDTTLVGAWIGKHNGVGLLGDPDGAGAKLTGRGTTVAIDGNFGTFGTDGAYAAGAITKIIPMVTAQAWAYDVVNIAQAYWLQADAKFIDMLNVGAQYAGMNPSTHLGGGTSDRSNSMWALKGSVDVANSNFYAAYSSVGTGTLGFANTATGDKTMMYTGLASVYLDGEIVGAPDTDAWKIGASTKLIPSVILAASYGEASTGNNGGTAGAVAGASAQNNDYSAWDIVAKTQTGPVAWTAIYTQFEKDVRATDTADKTTDTFRLIASLKF